MINKDKGFTIVELLIATVVFSIVLLLITGAIIQIGRSYTKGITQTSTQEAARRIADDVSEAIIFGANVPEQDDTAQKLCVGDKQYSYAKGRQVTSAANWGLIVASSVAGCLNSTSNIATSASRPSTFNELLGERMRLSNFKVTRLGTSNAYTVTVRVVSGDSDLLCLSPAIADIDGSDCNSNTVMNDSNTVNKDNLRCKNTKAGNEFCAMSELTTTVSRRLQ